MGLLTKLPRWATGGAALVTEPSEATKDAGWVPGAKPPAQWMNWLLKTTNDALTVLDGLQNLALTWALKHTFNAGLATPIAPTAANDVARKTEVDAEATSRASADAAEVTARNAAIAVEAAARVAATVPRAVLFQTSDLGSPTKYRLPASNEGTAPGYVIEPNGRVQLFGDLIYTGTGSGIVLLTMPAEARALHRADPTMSAGRIFSMPYVSAGAYATLMTISGQAGQLQMGATPSTAGSTVPLNNITYYAGL